LSVRRLKENMLTLNGGEETPVLLTGAVGIATVSVDAAAEELAVTLSLFNLPTGTTAGHIHIAPKGIAGPVVINFPIPTGRTGDLSGSTRWPTRFSRSWPAIRT
jgi:hypothetical protein